MVLLHGTPFSSFEWHRIAPHLAKSHRVYFFDMLGYGRSEMSDGQDVSLGVQNELFAALLQHWQISNPDVVAHDFGGATALRSHFINGCDFRSLTLVDAVALRPWGSPLVQHVKQYEAAFAGLPSYVHGAILQAYLATSVYHSLSEERLRPYLEPWLGPIGQAAFYRQIVQMDVRYTDEVQNLYPELRCPVQVLWGKDDEWIPIEKGRQLAGMMPGARLVTIEQCGHLMQEDAPEAILAALFEFLPVVNSR